MKRRGKLLLVLLPLWLNWQGRMGVVTGQTATPTGDIKGKVVDTLGTPIEGAAIQIFDDEGKILNKEMSREDGLFPIPFDPPKSPHLVVKHPDYKDGAKVVAPQANNLEIIVVLEPRPLQETVTVTATRTGQPLASVPSSIELRDRASLQRSPAVTLDDALRQIPAFSLFRRSSSLVAHPTTQGVSLRGIGPSGVSRTLVLWDGTPLNDPFGGWVYWSQLDKNSIEMIEVVPGGGSNLYGSSPLGGVIQVFSRVPEENRFELDIQGGTQATAGGEFLGTYLKGPWSGNVSGTFLHTDGYYIVPPEFRGPVDDRAGSVHYAVRAGAFYKPNLRHSSSLNFSHFGEYRDNGTVLQKNRSWITTGRAGYRYEASNGKELQVRAYGLIETFRGSFTSISADRQREFLTQNQEVPARSVGTSAQWTGLLKSAHLITTGLDWLLIRGNSEEVSYSSNVPTRFQVSGGNQQLGGVFIQDLFTPASRWLIQLSARLDGWTNYNAERTETSLLTGIHAQILFESQKRGTVNPRAGVSYQLSESLSLKGAVYQSFRAPTLNELYRGFRVGNVVTNPNDGLGPEKLRGGEGSVNWKPGANCSVRLAGFWNQLDNAVSNITVRSFPSLITRQRQNVGQIRAQGVEADIRVNLKRFWTFRASYLYSDSRVHDFPANPTLESRFVPQVPRNRVTSSFGYSNPRAFELLTIYRFVGDQYDDDLNMFNLGGFSVVDLYFSRAIHRNIRFYTSIENLLDRRFLVARTPVDNNGAPFMLHLGLRMTF